MLLVVNAGSSSIKLAVFDAGLREVLSARLTEIGGASVLEMGGVRRELRAADHRAALTLALQAMEKAGFPAKDFTAAAHRVVHGGAALTAPCRITPAVIDAIRACIPLAPLHNPANLTAILALQDLAPDLPQYASFDTAFHATNPDVATRYAIPQAAHDQGIRRFGFHGISYSALVRKVQEIAGNTGSKRLLALHLGNGASLCAIRDGASVATTMGYSPLDGLTMGTRSGAIDGNAVLRLAALHGIAGAAHLLNRGSGLLALGGHSDMRALHAAGTAEADFAIRHFCYWAVRHAGSMIAAMGGIDAVAFTGGIGENDAKVRAEILNGLAWAGVSYSAVANAEGRRDLHLPGTSVAIWIIAAGEERQIAAEALIVRAGENAS